MTPPVKTPEDFLLAVICPLEVEALAMIRQLDKDKDYGEEFSKDCHFTLGGIGEHNIIIASLPAGRQGHTSAAVAAQQTMARFPRITCILLVGIAGGAPSDKNDIRLGDVVVSFPCGKYGGVVQYDFGKDEEHFEHSGQTNSVPQHLLTYLSSIKLRHGRNRDTKPKYLKYLEAQMTDELEKPDSTSDRLFPASYIHQGGYDCTTCDETQAQHRKAREGPRVHYGLIASGNRVMKNAQQRDKYNQDHGGIVLAYEMEAAGLMNFTPCLVIRGISDYADSHKPPGKGWHAYAAAIATAYAREFIENAPTGTFSARQAIITLIPYYPGGFEYRVDNKYIAVRTRRNVHWVVPRGVTTVFTGRHEILKEIKGAILNSSCHGQQKRYIITGLGGLGKSELCLRIANDLRQSFWGIFWVNVTTPATAESDFATVAAVLDSSKSEKPSIRDALILLSNKDENWLLILDNADDPGFDFSQYFPSGVYGTILLTSRNPVLHNQSTIGFKSLDLLDNSDCISLLQKLIGKSQSAAVDSNDKATQDIVELIELLGAHTIALIQAGEYISRRRCTVQKYIEIFKMSRKRMAAYEPNPAYRSAYATFEASAAFLESSKEKREKDALFLLHLLPMLGEKDLTMDFFKAAWQAAKLVSAKDYRPIHKLTDATRLLPYLTPFVQISGIEHQDEWDPFYLESAIDVLTSLSLIRLSPPPNEWQGALLTMHPLTRAWAKDRQSPEDIDVSLISSGSLIAMITQTEPQLMARHNGKRPYKDDPGLPHFLRIKFNRPIPLTNYYNWQARSYDVPYLTENFTILAAKAKSSSPEWSASLAILTLIIFFWFLAPRMEVWEVRNDVVKQIFLFLGVDPQYPSPELLPLYIFLLLDSKSSHRFEAGFDKVRLLTAIVDIGAWSAETSDNPLLFFQLLSSLACHGHYCKDSVGGCWVLPHIRQALTKPVCFKFLSHEMLLSTRFWLARYYFFLDRRFEVVEEVLESQLPSNPLEITDPTGSLTSCYDLLALVYMKKAEYEKVILLLGPYIPVWFDQRNLDKNSLVQMCMNLALAYIGAGQMAQALSTFEDGYCRVNKMVLSGWVRVRLLQLRWFQSAFQLYTITVRSWMDADMEISGPTAIESLSCAAKAQLGSCPDY